MWTLGSIILVMYSITGYSCMYSITGYRSFPWKSRTNYSSHKTISHLWRWWICSFQFRWMHRFSHKCCKGFKGQFVGFSLFSLWISVRFYDELYIDIRMNRCLTYPSSVLKKIKNGSLEMSHRFIAREVDAAYLLALPWRH